MDIFKLQEKPLILNFFKPLAGSNDISKNEKGEVTNEWQPIKFVTLQTLQKTFKGIIAMGYVTVTVEDYGTFDKNIVDELLETIKVKAPSINKDIDALKSITEKLLEQNQKQAKELEELKKAQKGDIDEELEELKKAYSEKFNKNLPISKSKDKIWIQSKLEE